MKMFLPEVPEWWAYRASVFGNDNKSAGAYFVGHVLWQQYRLRKKTTGLKLPTRKLHKLGFGRSFVRSAINSLEDAGLVKVRRFRHKSPEITLVIDEKEIGKKSQAKIHTVNGGENYSYGARNP